MIKLKSLTVLAASFLLLWGMSCQSPSSSGNPSSTSLGGNQQASNSPTGPSVNKPGVGTLRVTITDAPVDNVEKIMVTITEIRVHQASGDENSGFVTVWGCTKCEEIDLLALKTIPIVLELPLAAGNYNQIRMSLSKDQCGIYFTGDPERHLLSVPSDEIKLHFPFDILSGGLTQIKLDFDAAGSLHVVQKGKNSEYILRPVVCPVIEP